MCSDEASPKNQSEWSAQGLWLDDVEYCLSPNYNDRPSGEAISLLVIHNISLPPHHFGGDYIKHLFTNCLNPEEHPYFKDIYQLEVSSHFLVNRQGKVTQFVACEKRAWHAGQSHFSGRDNCNDFSIGIELEGGDFIPYTQRQYVALVELIHSLKQRLPSLVDITGHEFIAPGRKTDPSPSFDWNYLCTMLGACSLNHNSVNDSSLNAGKQNALDSSARKITLPQKAISK